MDDTLLPRNQLPPLPVCHLLASFALQPAPTVNVHSIGVTAFAQFSSAIRITQLIDAIERSACAHLHLSLTPGSFVKAFHSHSLPGISNHTPSLAASAVVDVRKRNLLTDAKFVITKPGFPKVSCSQATRPTRAHPDALYDRLIEIRLDNYSGGVATTTRRAV